MGDDRMTPFSASQHALFLHHQLNRVATAAAGQTVPQVFAWSDAEARCGVIVERAAPPFLRPFDIHPSLFPGKKPVKRFLQKSECARNVREVDN